ncbi:MAG: SRPBCC domain-containing protein [Saprospiraceae bacterium]|nr:SRPBCC domain-containing protein [Saprospiraceae bacterium]
MNKTLITEHPERQEMIVSRAFNGPVELVWRAWTEPELLARWWAPRPWKAVTKHMDFREGGHWLYCMQGPDGEQHWGRANYHKIVVHDYFDAEDVFCDEEGNVNTELPGTRWHVTFTPLENGTRVDVHTKFDSVEAMRQLIAMGVKEGTTMAHDNLDALLEEIQAQA